VSSSSRTNDDDSDEANPVDSELIAYLDGELEATDARRIEDQLDADPRLRARAEALKRSFDLLEFLPKPEPTPTFATRTMDKLPVDKSAALRSAAIASTASTPIPAVSSMSSLALPGSEPRPGAPVWAWAAGILVAAGVALGLGYLGTAGARSYFFTPPSVKDADALPLADVAMIEKLPLYAAVDDLDFLNQLSAPEYFGEEPALPDGIAPPPLPEAEKPSPKQLEDLWRKFRDLPTERQQKIRALDQQIHAMDPARHERSSRLLEAYVAWLQNLSEADRKAILSAPTSDKRLEAIREVHVKQWIVSLPAAQRQKLKDLPAAEKAELITRWRLDEQKSREDWAFARLQWDSIRTNRQPWPFMDERLQKEVRGFVLAAYHPNDPRRNRLSSQGLEGGDAARMKEALDRADKGEWALLGKVTYDMSKKYEMLPEPGRSNAVTDFPDLTGWPAAHRHYEMRKAKAKERIEKHVGRWPDFALAVFTDPSLNKVGPPPKNFHLGPCSPDEFKDDLRKFLHGEFKKRTTDAQRDALRAIEGQWPAYPRELIKLAKAHDLSVPGAMPPGPPSQWERTYNPQKPMRPGG
jgi:hypothetical protein